MARPITGAGLLGGTLRIWAFDPGSVATGVAFLHKDYEYWSAEQFPDVGDAWHYVDTSLSFTDTFLIEMYRSAGYLNKHAQATIEALGFLKNVVTYYLSVDPIMVPEQARISGQREAAALMGSSIEELREDSSRKDAFSALSHCCSYRRELLNG